MNIILFDHADIRQALLPLTFTRPVSAIRVGILTIAEKWAKRLEKPISYYTSEYLREKYAFTPGGDNYWINGAVCPNDQIIEAAKTLQPETALVFDGLLLMARTSSSTYEDLESLTRIELSFSGSIIRQPWQIFKENAIQIKEDFSFITKGRTSQPISDPHTIVYGKENIFIEEGAKIRAAIINAEDGPVYIGKNAVISEGAIVKGALALCEGAQIGMGAKLRGDSTIGPYSKVGGEVSNSVIFGYSNKGHDGFLGNSVLGEWCNLGADTNTSNLKNNYADVKIWDYAKNSFKDTGEMFCGLIMGDHSKCGINTMFNTGTVVGVSANIFGAGFPRNFIPSFSWGGANGFTTFQLSKADEVAEKVMERRNVVYSDLEQRIIKSIFEQTVEYRYWEKK